MKKEDILAEIKKDKYWILSVIRSCESEDQLKSCYNIIRSWSNRIKGHIEKYNCPFYKFKEIRNLEIIYKSLENKYYLEIDEKIVNKYRLIEN
jgi:hypothetical protein